MYCEVCGSPADWRTTNNITNMAKYKCRSCGHITVAEAEPWVEVERECTAPRYYGFNVASGMWKVCKVTGYKCTFFAQYPQEEAAKAVVEELKKCNWDKSCLPLIHERLGIRRVNRRWVWT